MGQVHGKYGVPPWGRFMVNRFIRGGAGPPLTQPSGPGQSYSSDVRLSVCDVAKQPLPGVVETSGRRTYS